jgi:hypothetical protein
VARSPDSLRVFGRLPVTGRRGCTEARRSRRLPARWSRPRSVWLTKWSVGQTSCGALRIDLVGTTADFRRFRPPRPLQVNHLPCENCAMLGRIGEVGLVVALAIALAGSGPLSAREHRSREVTREFQREHPCPSSGKTSGACPGYRKDHVVPLACDGPDAVSNLQWQTRWERRFCGR